MLSHHMSDNQVTINLNSEKYIYIYIDVLIYTLDEEIVFRVLPITVFIPI